MILLHHHLSICNASSNVHKDVHCPQEKKRVVASQCNYKNLKNQTQIFTTLSGVQPHQQEFCTWNFWGSRFFVMFRVGSSLNPQLSTFFILLSMWIYTRIYNQWEFETVFDNTTKHWIKTFAKPLQCTLTHRVLSKGTKTLAKGTMV
jgi:hypothetical protein